MKRSLTSTLVLGLSMAVILSSNGEANARGGNGSHPSVHAASNHRVHAPTNHIAYKHRNFHNWSSWCWNSRFRCYFYGCGGSCYYYWYAPACCYYPVTYINVYPPVEVVYQTAVAGMPPLPAGVGPAPGGMPGTPGPLPVR